jgi:hypothetical protein
VETNQLKLNLENRMKKTTKKTTAPVAAPVAAKATVTPVAPAAVNTPTASAAVAASAGPVKAAPAPAKTQIVTSAAPITIEAKIDVGFGNNLFVRGQGAGLSWERGIPLECVDSKTWRLTVPAKDTLQFKLLINDTVWAKGEDVVATPGKRVEVVPAF